MWQAPLFSLLLVGLSLGMIIVHRRIFRMAIEQELDESESQYLHQQYRRRMLASSLIGVVGLALWIGLSVRHPAIALCFWTAVSAVVCWTGWLGIVDWKSSQRNYQVLKKRNVDQHTMLKDELKKILQTESNAEDEEV